MKIVNYIYFLKVIFINTFKKFIEERKGNSPRILEVSNIKMNKFVEVKKGNSNKLFKNDIHAGTFTFHHDQFTSLIRHR